MRPLASARMVDTAATASEATTATETAELPTRVRRRRDPFDAPDSILAVALAALATVTIGLLVHLGRGTTFFFDEWDWIQTRRSGLANPLFRPHNGHLSAVPVAIFRLLLATVGLRHYLVFRLVAVAFELLTVALFTAVVRRRLPAPYNGSEEGDR